MATHYIPDNGASHTSHTLKVRVPTGTPHTDSEAIILVLLGRGAQVRHSFQRVSATAHYQDHDYGVSATALTRLCLLGLVQAQVHAGPTTYTLTDEGQAEAERLLAALDGRPE